MRNPAVTLCRHLDRVAPGWPDWEVEAVWDALETLPEGTVDVDDPALADLLGALQVMRQRPERFWGEWEVFENCAHALNGNPCDFGLLQPVSPAEAALAVHLARSICPGQPAYEVSAYIEAVLHAAGLSTGVGPLAGIQDRSAHPRRREAALARLSQLRPLGTDAEVAETETDVEAARLLAICLYLDEHAPGWVAASPAAAPSTARDQSGASLTGLQSTDLSMMGLRP